MPFYILIILSIIQGLTEFLPISSSGHLVIMYNLFGINDGSKLLSILLHIATLLSVIVYYRKELWQLIKKPLCSTNLKLIVTTITTCVLVLIIKPLIDLTFSGKYLFVFFIITAVLLYISDYITYNRNLSTNKNILSHSHIVNNNITNLHINYKQAIIIGITQGIACIPGISRSGSTIAVSRIMGINQDATTYSFLISIPIIIASLILEIIEGGISLNISLVPLIVCMIICFFIGIICIKLMTKFVNSNRLSYFSYYLIILSSILVFCSLLK